MGSLSFFRVAIMYEYNCNVKRIVDGDTVDVIIDLGLILVIQVVFVYLVSIPRNLAPGIKMKRPEGL